MSDAKATKKTAPKKPAEHPKYSEMVQAAIATLKERNGSSRQAIVKYIKANYKVSDNCDTHIKQALKKGVTAGTLAQPKGTGASGSFKLIKKAAEPKKKKPAAKKPAVAKKTTPKKKAAPKKKASAKKPATKSTPKKKAASKAKKPASAAAAKKVAAKKPAAKKVAKKPAAKKAVKKTPKKRPAKK